MDEEEVKEEELEEKEVGKEEAEKVEEDKTDFSRNNLGIIPLLSIPETPTLNTADKKSLPGLVQIVPEEDFSHSAVEIGDFDSAELSDGGPGVGPIQLLPDPIDGDAVGGNQARRNHRLGKRVRDGICPAQVTTWLFR